jgi:uncharacterized protein YgiM (DUF1202 family)
MRFAITTSLIALALCGLITIAALAQPAAAPQPTPPKAVTQAPAQPTETPAFPWEGEVSGTNVYLRSGAGVNWYPTAKLNTGDRVLVLSEKFGWYQVAPPKGSFSYVDKSMVERQPADAKTGTVKADKVYVRAGSELEDRKSATQIMLDKGAKVEILGEAEGFYKIHPPKGASLYVSKTYVEPVASRLRTGLAEQHAAAAAPATPKTEPTPATATKSPTDATTPGAAPAATPPAPGAAVPTGPVTPGAVATTQPDEGPVLEVEPGVEPSPKALPVPSKPGVDKALPAVSGAGKSKGPAPAKTTSNRPRYDVMLSELDSLMRAELKRPVKEQDLAALQSRFEEIANQKEENIPAQIAKIRLQQLKDWQALVAARGDSVVSAADLESYRAQLTEERAKIMQRPIEKAAIKYDLEGELRRSFAFASQQGRYRLVDSAGSTVAYVDIPPTLSVNVENLVGCMVGIVASEKQFSPAARVPIAVAKDVVDLSYRNLPGGTGNPEQSLNPENTGAAANKSTAEAAGTPAPRPAPVKPLAAGQGTESPE